MDTQISNGMFASFWSTLISVLYSRKTLIVPQTFHERCGVIKAMTENDTTGLINSLLNYSINSAASAKFSVECENENLQALLNMWLDQINLQIEGIPTGLDELAKDYYRERWAGSSFCAMRMQQWKEIKLNGNSIFVPTVMALVNGASLYVKRNITGNFKLGSDKYFLDQHFKNELQTTEKEAVVIQKPFNRWFDKYPTPYLISTGVYKNFLVFDTLAHKSDEVVAKIVPYLFEIIKNTENMMVQGKLNYTSAQMKEEIQQFKEAMNTYENEPGKTPMSEHQIDTKYAHSIPEIEPIVKTALLEGIYKVVAKNEKNKKFFAEKNKINIIASPLKINIESILDAIRSGYDRGPVSAQSYLESIGFDYEQEMQRRTKEADNGVEDLFYPHLVQNIENKGEDIHPSKLRNNDKLEKLGKKPGTPEAKNFKKASIDTLACQSCKENIGYYKIGENGEALCPKCGAINKVTEGVIGEPINRQLPVVTEPKTENELEQALEIEKAPYDTNRELPPAVRKKSKHAQDIWRSAFNSAFKSGKDEASCFKIAWSAMNTYLQKEK